MKEFVAASKEEKKSIFAKIEEEAGKLSGSAARYRILYLILSFSFLTTTFIVIQNVLHMVCSLPDIVL